MPETVKPIEAGNEQADDRFTAPGALEMLQCFANTHHVHDDHEFSEEHSHEHLVDPAGLRDWLLEHNLIGSRDRVTPADHRDALQLRDALRALAHANHGERIPADALRVLERAAAAAELQPRFRAGERPTLEPQAKGPAGAFGRLVAIAFASMSEGSWPRLKICRDDTCAVVFYDYSKNQSRSWCSMQLCGNRAKVRNFRRRGQSGRSVRRRSGP